MMASYVAKGITINVSSSTPYVIDSDGVDMTGLPFTPNFDPATSSRGNAFMLSSAATMGAGMGGMVTGTINASEIDLERGVSGTVSGYTQTGSQAISR